MPKQKKTFLGKLSSFLVIIEKKSMDCVRNFVIRTVQTQSLIILVLFCEIME